ncbi:hypothetical protein CAPTEDRAFT_21910 [Capitella teleta]|uniref:Serine/threonine-protein phosphatase PGAM5, mitochondrial n=1 Tax=Capitella teleta TaxID=283909 RepID=R7VFR0_CAPTE|nr:hypothetical protein CAPTEDRAFT_21910 [Capitella teleta]|eukprot:ELU15131.1 hypothetical protein CAPTEDRAFT_21910 [Capitella teleta]
MSWALKGNRAWGLAAGLAGCAVVGTVLKSNWDENDPENDILQLTTEQSQKKRSKKFIPRLPLSTVLASWTTNHTPAVAWDHDWDKRDPKSLIKPLKLKKTPDVVPDSDDMSEEIKKNTPKASRHLYLIRHGQYNLKANEDKGRDLTKLGRDQAHLTGKRLQALNVEYDTLVHSTLTRATETADCILEHLKELPVQKCDLLQEGAPCPPEPPVGHWRPEGHQFFRDGARIEAAFRKYFHRAEPTQLTDSREVIVCHANVIRYFVCRALQIQPEAWLRMSLAHGSITHIIIRPSGRVVLYNLGDSGHLPVDMVTQS